MMNFGVHPFAIVSSLILQPEVRNDESFDIILEQEFWNVVQYSYDIFKSIEIRPGSKGVKSDNRKPNAEIPSRKSGI